MLRSVTLCDMVPFTFTRLLDSYAIEKRTAFQQWVKTLYEIVCIWIFDSENKFFENFNLEFLENYLMNSFDWVIF